MDRIDTSGPNALVSRPKAGASAPVSQVEKVRPLTGAAGRTIDRAVPGSLLAGAEAPVDRDRVSEIRKAVEEGRYPVLPERIADAMIAAGYILRAKR